MEEESTDDRDFVQDDDDEFYGFNIPSVMQKKQAWPSTDNDVTVETILEEPNEAEQLEQLEKEEKAARENELRIELAEEQEESDKASEDSYEPTEYMGINPQ